jgi:lysophospholipase L1-like esterase
MPLRKAAIFSLVWTVLLLGVLEGGLRFYAYIRAERTRGRGLPPPAERRDYQVLDPILGYALKPGYSAKGISINSLGFRGPELTPEKPRGTTRIFAIGDSTTFGLSGEDCPYPVQMQRLLDAAYGRGTFQVINAGVEGYSTDYALRLLETRISPLSPDIVIVYIGWNDLYSTSPHKPRLPVPEEIVRVDLGGWKGKIASALDNLYIAKALNKMIYVYLPAVLPVKRLPVSPEFTTYFKTRLTQIIQIIRRAGAKPVLLTLPTVLSEQMSDRGLKMLHYPSATWGDRMLFLDMYHRFDHAIRETAEEEKVPLVDIAARIDRLNKDTLFFDSLHMQCEGYAEVARYIVSELRRQGLISTT